MKRMIFKLLIASSSAIVLIFLIFFTNSVEELRFMFANAKLYWIAAAFGCMVTYWIFDALILHAIILGLLEKQPLKDTVRITMIGQFFNSITPLSGAGQPVQAYVMVKDGIKPGHAASIIVIKSLLHQLIIVLYSLVTFALKGPLFGARITHFYYLYIVGLVINMAFLLFYVLFFCNRELAGRLLVLVFKLVRKIRFIKNADTLQARVENELSSFSEGAAMLRNNIGIFIRLVIFQVAQFTFFFSIPYFIHLAVETNAVQLWDMVAAQSMITLISLLVPSPGATGGIEGLSYLFYGMFFTQSFIIPVILIFRLLTYYASVVVGGLFTFFAPEKPLKQPT
jgi:glycosyltransferase 2 family protein